MALADADETAPDSGNAVKDPPRRGLPVTIVDSRGGRAPWAGGKGYYHVLGNKAWPVAIIDHLGQRWPWPKGAALTDVIRLFYPRRSVKGVKSVRSVKGVKGVAGGQGGKGVKGGRPLKGRKGGKLAKDGKMARPAPVVKKRPAWRGKRKRTKWRPRIAPPARRPAPRARFRPAAEPLK
jgi:hypothetical protein